MINYISKYRKHYSYLLLSGYLFLVALSVFHYHHIDILKGNYQFNSLSGENASAPIDILVGLDNECIVSHFASTISSINYFPENYFRYEASKTYTSFESPGKLFCVVLFRNNPLRAPPSVLPS
jgi:hypothetical protein